MRSYSSPVLGAREAHGLPQVENRVSSIDNDQQLKKLEEIVSKPNYPAICCQFKIL